MKNLRRFRHKAALLSGPREIEYIIDIYLMNPSLGNVKGLDKEYTSWSAIPPDKIWQ